MADINAEWAAAAAAVTAGADELRAATTHREIRAWADSAGMANRKLWPKVKTELRKQLGIDYDAIREQTTEREASEVAAAAELIDAPTVELYCAGDDEVGTYAVCAASDDRESWYGEFHPKDTIYRAGDDLSAEHSAADKAIYLAGQARQDAGLDAVRLVLHTSHHDLDTAVLAATASRHRVAVTLELSDQNPAIALCRAPGYRGWREIRLTTLFAPAEVAS